MKIDWWTLGFQTVNILVLIWLLKRFFWRPVAKIIADRAASTQKTLAEAETKRSEATAALAEIEKTRAGFAAERNGILTAARKTADDEHTAKMSQAQNEAASLVSIAKARIETDKAAIDKAWRERASRLAVEIAPRLPGRLEGQALNAIFLNSLLQAIAALPETERHGVGDAALDATSAEALDPAEQELCRAGIAKAFQANPHITFKVDPALIHGLELHGAHFTVSNSWQADLDRILTGLMHDGQQ